MSSHATDLIVSMRNLLILLQSSKCSSAVLHTTKVRWQQVRAGNCESPTTNLRAEAVRRYRQLMTNSRMHADAACWRQLKRPKHSTSPGMGSASTETPVCHHAELILDTFEVRQTNEAQCEKAFCGPVNTITRNCVHRFSPNWVWALKVVTISGWLNSGRPAPPGRGSAVGRIFFWIRLINYSQRAVFASLRALFSLLLLLLLVDSVFYWELIFSRNNITFQMTSVFNLFLPICTCNIH